MGNKFNPDDLKNPLYEHSQVVTFHDLHAIYAGLAAQFKMARWWEFEKKKQLTVAGHIIWELADWLRQGKPSLREVGDIK